MDTISQSALAAAMTRSLRVNILVKTCEESDARMQGQRDGVGRSIRRVFNGDLAAVRRGVAENCRGVWTGAQERQPYRNGFRRWTAQDGEEPSAPGSPGVHCCLAD